jgi:drug/metabolite transporter (DMT)-like permease
MTVGLPVLWLIIRVNGESVAVPREHWGELTVIALTNMTVWYICVMYGVMLLPSGRAAILGYTMPIWVALLGVLLFGDRPERRLLLGVAAAAAGVSLLLAGEFSAISGSPLGSLLILGAAVTWGYGTHRMRRRRHPTSALVVTFWALLQSWLACACLALLTERGQWDGQASMAAWVAVFYNGVLIFAFTQVLWFRLASTLPPMASSLSVMLIPVIGVFAGTLWLGEPIAWQDWAALGCIVLAIASVLLPRSLRR